MASIFLIRHGQPSQAWGGAGSDPGLSDLGAAQAEAAATALEAFGDLKIVSSPMRRCVETAAPYARRRGIDPTIEDRVSEIVSTEGVADRAAWLQERFPWRDRTQKRTWSTLEPRLHEWRDAMLRFIRELREDTAVFTHFIAINVICGAAEDVEHTIVCTPGHASITEIEVRGGALRLMRHGAEMQVDDVR